MSARIHPVGESAVELTFGSIADRFLGKTVQAGLVLAERSARRREHRVLIVSPAIPVLC